MRHRIAGTKLSRNTAHRKAMWRNMAVSLFTHGQITTTVPKAKSIKPFVEKLITTARQGDLAARRRVIQQLGDPIMIKHDSDEAVERNAYGEVTGGPRLVKKLFDEIAPRYAQRPGGYTRIVKLGKHRIGDAADLCVLQLVRDEDTGPQVAGQLSKRRDIANRRMARAADVRKNLRSEAGATAVTEEPAASQTPAAEPESTQSAE